ncbi:hypothetical protein KP509_14G056400 [Ceratopteris richardii]|uniref:RRM domain-containing protein n=1 Tax=Ceratopteris richardii TaxID=49495 RepID=A0A8T2TA16_CERRI|nr:hypothetical protein KP509_14G056400 [Ceratopteris richardii]
MASEVSSQTIFLHISGLHSSTEEANLHDLFSGFGPVASIQIIRPSVSSTNSVCNAIVHFQPSVDRNSIVQASQSLQNTLVNGQPIRILMCDSNANPSEESCIGKVFVKGLHESIGDTELRGIFSPIGKVASCEVSLNDGRSNGYGFVQFETEEVANLSIQKMDGAEIKGKILCVAKFDPKRYVEAETNLYIKNIGREITEEALKEEFHGYGEITSLIIMKDADGNSKGFGFVSFKTKESAENALKSMNGKILGSKALYVAQAQKKAERERMLQRQFEERTQKYKGCNLYVKNLADLVDDKALCEHFSIHGNIISAKVMLDEKGLSKGFGFVCFSSPQEAQSALSDYQSILFGRPIYVAVAQPKEIRHAQLENMFAQKTAAIDGPQYGMLPFVDCPSGSCILPPPPVSCQFSPSENIMPTEVYTLPSISEPMPQCNILGAPMPKQVYTPSSVYSGFPPMPYFYGLGPYCHPQQSTSIGDFGAFLQPVGEVAPPLIPSHMIHMPFPIKGVQPTACFGRPEPSCHPQQSMCEGYFGAFSQPNPGELHMPSPVSIFQPMPCFDRWQPACHHQQSIIVGDFEISLQPNSYTELNMPPLISGSEPMSYFDRPEPSCHSRQIICGGDLRTFPQPMQRQIHMSSPVSNSKETSDFDGLQAIHYAQQRIMIGEFQIPLLSMP